MIVHAVCPQCSETRYESTREFQRGEKLDPAAFRPLGDSPLPDHGKPARCYVCQTDLLFRFVPPQAVSSPSSSPTPGATSPGGTIQVLFAAEPNEQVTTMKPLTEVKYLVVTNRRILIVDVEPYLTEAANA